MAKHSKGVQKEKFCALRTGSDQKCVHSDGSKGNNYRDNCEPDWVKKDKYVFYQGSKKTKKGFEAHHLLCVAAVTKFLAKKKGITGIIKQTKWCINAKKNMYAMPLWGNTIRHYCTIETTGIKLADRIQRKKTPPPFENIPQHDYDHNSTGGYKDEVDNETKKLAKQIADQKDNHKQAIKDLKSKLNLLSTHFRNELKRRGGRCDGTHNAWKNANKLGDSWCEPFSMADDGAVNMKAFPLTSSDDNYLQNKIVSLVKSFIRT